MEEDIQMFMIVFRFVRNSVSDDTNKKTAQRSGNELRSLISYVR